MNHTIKVCRACFLASLMAVYSGCGDDASSETDAGVDASDIGDASDADSANDDRDAGAGGDVDTGDSGDAVEPDASDVGDSGSEPPPRVAVEVQNGEIEGIVMGQTREFLGIPYAKPPVGPLRFMPPEPAEPWSGTLDATHFGSACPQASETLTAGLPLDEDCLTLNVFAPDDASASDLPVMVFIHGGGFTIGTGGAYDGQQLSEAGPVVVVTINYRLGALGFFASPELDATREDQPSGNDAIRDQQLALRWVKDNIAVFGGDPDNVTVFGESAGSGSTCVHIVSPGSQDLAHGFILESGVCVGGGLGARSREDLIDTSQGLVDALCDGETDGVACLRSKPTEEIVAWGADLGSMGAGWSPVIDGDDGVMPDSPTNLIESGQFNHSPIIVGTNKYELGLYQRMGQVPVLNSVEEFETRIEVLFGDDAAEVQAVYQAESDQEANDLYVTMLTDLAFRCPTRVFARLLSDTGSDVYLYSFDEGTAYHGEELQYLFDTAFESSGSAADDSQQLPRIMKTYWTNFAKNGDPNGSDAPEWPLYETDSDRHMRLTSAVQAASGLAEDACDFWADYVEAGGSIDVF